MSLFESLSGSSKKSIYAINQKNQTCLKISKDSIELVAIGECTYIVLNPSNKQIKIGKTTNIDQRLNTLRTANPDITLLLLLPSKYITEAELHNKFSTYRNDREWFFYTKEIQEFVDKQNKIINKSVELSESYLKYIEIKEELQRLTNTTL